MKLRNVQLKKRPKDKDKLLRPKKDQESKGKKPKKLNALLKKKDKTSLQPKQPLPKPENKKLKLKRSENWKRN